MQNKRQKRKLLLVILTLIMLIVGCMYIDCKYTDAIDTKISTTYPKAIKDNWQYNNKNILLPTNINVPVGSKAVISGVLPYISENEYICITSSNQSVEVSIDGNVIYKRGYDIHNNPIDMPGSFYNLIKIPENSSGKKISISYLSKYKKHSGEFSEVLYGTKGDLVLYIIRQGFHRVIVILCLDIIALICFAIVFFYKDKHRVKNFINLGAFCIITSVWVFTESGLSQFIFHNQHIVKTITYFCIMLAPIPINLFIKDIVNNKFNKYCVIFAHIYVLDFIINILLEHKINNIFEISLKFTHAIILLNSLIIFYALVHDFNKHNYRYRKYVMVCMTPIIIATVSEIVGYYVSDVEFYSAKRIVIGFAVSIIYLLVITIMDFTSVYKQAEYTKILNMLAFQDTVTKGNNRTAFYRDVDMLSISGSKDKLCIMVLDLNNLKKINDIYGHTVGDEAIKQCYDCMKRCIPESGTCYRIGGDEFVSIFTECNVDIINEFIRQFENSINEYNEKVEYDFHVAYGYSFYDKEKDKDLMATFNRSDKLMYSRKKLMKEI